ncbi:MAG: Acyl-CoA dehydrogenase [Marmoricola sp.]|nr:Acyl-CoA dehydrogenase [Marmoricola sp.]
MLLNKFCGYSLPVRFEPTELTPQELELQRGARAFLRDALPQGSYEPGLGMDSGRDAAFSQQLAKYGWIGVAIPTEYGGRNGTAVDRFVITEELLRSGAPVTHHWVADRQTAPLLLKFGTEEQKRRFLPAIASAEISFCIGMSEHEAGSDLTAVRTSATRTDGGWLLNGTKVWTSNAMDSDWFVILCRTGTDPDDRHAGLSQFLVDLRTEGVTRSPIPFLDPSTHFAEVLLDNVLVPDDCVLGVIGQGWVQNTNELAYERGGPDRWLSTYGLVEAFIREYPEEAKAEQPAQVIGEIVAKYWALRRLSLSVARSIDRKEAPAAESALVKEMGTRFEQDVIIALQCLLDVEPRSTSASVFERLLSRAILSGPSFTIRGGTIEILRSVAMKGLVL